MDCPECERLRIERDTRERIYELATHNFDSVATSKDIGEYIRLKTLDDEAKIELDLVVVEIAEPGRRCVMR